MPSSLSLPLERIRAGLAGANAHDLQQVEHEDLSVADLAGLRGFLDRLDRAVDKLVRHGGLDLHLREKIDDIFGAAIELGVALLPPESLDLGNRDALHADRRQRFTHFVELEGFDDRENELHRGLSSLRLLGNIDQNVFCTNTVPVARPMLRPASV